MAPRKKAELTDAAPAAAAPSSFSDGYANFITSLGAGKDKATGGFFFTREHSFQELEAIYRSSWIGRKIIDIPTSDMTRRWRAWELPDPLVTKIEAAEKKFSLRARVTDAIRWGRLFGSAAVVLGFAPRFGTPDKPVDYDQLTIGDLIYTHVAFARELTIAEWQEDPMAPGFGLPVLYNYSPQGHRESADLIPIHASRIVPFAGAPLPPYAALSGRAWGDSVFAALEQTLMSASSITAVIASLVHESKVDVITVAGLANNLATAAGQKLVQQRFTLAAYLKSVNNAILLGDGDKYEQKQIAFAGLSDVHLRIFQEICGAADIPATRMLGQSPAGMNATGESDLRNYYDGMSAKQETELRPKLDVLDRVLFASEGITIPQGKSYNFAPLWQETPAQKAVIAFQKAQATNLISTTGLVSDDVLSPAVISQMLEDGVFPGLKAAIDKATADGKPINGAGRAQPVAPAAEHPVKTPGPDV